MARIAIAVFLCCPGLVLGFGGWMDPPGGWDYVYEANDGEDAYMAQDWTLGCLDGDWMRSSNSDEWDGSGCGDGAPGGAWIDALPGEGEGGGEASVLTIEDAGDPRDAGMGDPSNRKLFLVRPVDFADYDLSTGLTFVARIRLNPDRCDEPVGDPVGTNGVKEGYHFHNNGKGNVGYAQPDINLVMVLDDWNYPDEPAVLKIGNTMDAEPWPAAIEIEVDDPFEWVTVWVAAELDGFDYHIAVYVNGETDARADDLYTGILSEIEGAAGGQGIDRYFVIAAGNTDQAGSFQIDYLATYPEFLEPEAEAPECPTGLRCEADGDAGIVRLTWQAPSPEPQSYRIERDGVVLEDALPGSAAEYEDAGATPGEHDYKLSATVEGTTCADLTCSVTLCPSALACDTPDGKDVVLTWESPFPVGGYRILRDGVEVGTAPGDAVTFTDAGAPRGAHAYEVVATPDVCETLECEIYVSGGFEEERPYALPEGGWDYCYDPAPGDSPEEMLQYEPGDHVAGCLDGSWMRLGGSDRWDGSAPGDVEEGFPGGYAPGGLDLLELDGQGYQGERIAVLALEDTGNPSATGFMWKGAPFAWNDDVDGAGGGSNRKIFLGMDLEPVLDIEPGMNLLADGATLSARFRLMPLEDARDLREEKIGLDAPQGSSFDGNDKGFINLYTENEALLGTAKLSFVIDGEAETGWELFVDGLSGARFPIMDPTRWLTLYATIADPEFDGTYELRLYANGATEPFYWSDEYVPTGGGSEAGGVLTNYLVIGSNQTPEIAAYELDFICVKAGVIPPEGGGPVTAVFLRGDTDASGGYTIGDGIQVLNYLFGGAALGSNCIDTADLDDNGVLTIGDAVWVFNFLFGGGADPKAPYPGCGRDPTPSTTLGCEGYPADRCP